MPQHILSMHEPFKKPASVPHTPQGISLLIDRLKNMECLTGERPQVILESTGNYSKPISCILQEAGYSVIVLNPIQTHQQKCRSIRKVTAIAELRVLCQHYDGINSLYIESQLRFQSVLDLLFPYYSNVFSTLCGDSSLHLLAAFPKDVNRFSVDHQLTAYASLDASVFESGKFKSSRNKISKRGSAYLRKALFQAAKAAIRTTKQGPVNPLLQNYYLKKVSAGKPKMVRLLLFLSLPLVGLLCYAFLNGQKNIF